MTNQEYWEIRALQKEQRLKNRGERFLRELEGTYRKATEEISKDLENWVKRYAQENEITQAQARILLSPKQLKKHHEDVMDFIEKARLGEPYTDELRKRYITSRVSRLHSIQQRIELQLELLSQSKDVKTFEYLKETYKEIYYETAHQLYFGPTGEVVIPREVILKSAMTGLNERVIETIVRYPWSGKNFSQRIWKHNRKLVREVKEVLSVGSAQGHSIDKMTKKLAKRMAVSYSDSKRLVRTETNYVMSEATKDLYQECELKKYQFLATLDYKTSEVCQELDGKVFLLKDRKVGVNCNPMHPNCRSTTIPYFPDLQGQRIARGSDGKSYYVDRHTNYKEWFEGLPAEEKEKMNILRKMNNNKSADQKQYDKYVEMLGKNRVGKTFDEFQKMKYFDKEGFERVHLSYRSEKVKKYIQSGKQPLSIDNGQQNKHIAGTNEYMQKQMNLSKKGQYGPSVVTISKDEMEQLVSQYAGTGDFKLKFGKPWSRKEVILDNEKIIGEVVDNIQGIKVETTVFKIHYGKKGIHIVPDYPSKKSRR